MLRPAEVFIGLLPSYHDTPRGRQKVGPIKFAITSVGIVALFVDINIVTLIIFLICLFAATTLPMVESIKRNISSNLKLRGQREHLQKQPVRLVLDARRLALYVDDRLDRRILTNRKFDLKEAASEQGIPCILIRGERTRKIDTLVVMTDEQRARAEPTTDIINVKKETDRPVFITSAHWRQLLEELEARRKGD